MKNSNGPYLVFRWICFMFDFINYFFTVNGQPQPLENDKMKQIKTELRNIRDRVIQLIDVLEPSSDISSSSVDSVLKGMFLFFLYFPLILTHDNICYQVTSVIQTYR